jgi:long-subunit fatty acid transport protein
MRNLYIVAALMSATSVNAGGWEASRLDTSFMYQEGNYAEASYASIGYDITSSAFNGASNSSVKAAKDQNRAAASFKTSYGGFDIGLTRFNSGTIQMSGGAGTFGTGGTMVPDADAPLNTMTLMGKYGISDNLDLLFGLNRNVLASSVVTTIMGRYDIKSSSSTGALAGFAYSKPEIALRVELLVQPKSEITADTAYTASALGKAPLLESLGGSVGGTGYGASDVASFNSTLSRPDTVTLNFQSGVAKDTLVYGSVHKTDWKTAQVTVPTGYVFSAVASDFSNTTAYSIGVARKISDSLALTTSFNKEAGSGNTGTSLFTMSNGNAGVSAGARYTVDNMTISGGYNYTKVGDVTITSGGNTAVYTGNKVSALALKVGFSF